MLKNMQRISVLLCLFFIVQTTPNPLNAQINTPSGATIPFGSNITYPGTAMMPTNLPTNGTYNQAQDAADAYNTWKSSYVESCGGSNPERFRVKFDNPSETVSEGIAYGMLLAAYAADKALFDGLWDYYKNFMDGNGVMNWKIGGCSGVIGSGGATDAELDAAMALLVANHQWPNTTSPHNYESDATALINALKTHEIQPTNANGPYQANNGDNWGFGNDCRNPSYQSPAYYKAYGEFMSGQETFWDNCVDASYTLLNANAHPTTGLVSNWSDPSGNPNSCNGPNEFGWDACRNPWRMGTDVAWYSDPEAAALCNKMAAWMQGVGASNLKGPIPQNGNGGSYHSPAFVSTWAVALMGANSSYQSLLNSVYSETVATMDSPPYYFGNTLRAISLFNLTGNFWNPLNVGPPAPQTPVVSISNPTDNETLQLGGDITITTTATDNDGTISNVVIDIDGTPITSTNTNGNIYEATWTPTAIGTYTITVTATDDEGMMTTESVTVTISDDPIPPVVSISNPSNGTTIQSGNTINIIASASDSDGSIASVVIDIDGTPITSTNTNGNTYEATWNPTTIGTYTITVTATDDEGEITTSSVTVTISDDPPTTGDYNYGEVLQKSLFFYEAQQSGPIPAENRVHWRGDSGMDDGSDVNADLTGGWYDAGDHVKFGFPMAYSATMLAWSGVEDQTAYQSIGQWEYLKNNLRFVNDYLMKCHIRNGDGSTSRFYGQVGNGSADHAWWGSAEVMQMDRPTYFVDATNPGSDLTGETAAALAAASMIFANDDPTYSAALLEHAIALYTFADTYRGKYSDAITDATAFYNSWSGYQDELVWGAIWLYRATNDSAWLTKAQNEYQNLSTEQGTNIPSYHWTLAWDDKAYGCYALMAQLTNQQSYKDDTERWLDYWSTGYNGDRINYSPGGQAHLSTWGSLRYAANTAFVALVYSDVIATSNPTKSQVYQDFGTTQINYALGSNPNNRSYVCGFGNNPPINPHHRTAHGSWANSIGTPTDNRHILYGALVGGPGSANDQYTDDRGDYIANEVACDYNAGFTGAIANLLGRFGGSTLPDFPQSETYDTCDEYYNEAKINTSSNTFTEVAIWATNHSAWPATETDQVCYRYFVDISEGIAAGYSVADYTININTAPNGTTVSPLTQWDGTVYYVEVCFLNINIYPGGQSESHKEAQLRIALPNNAPNSAWDATNDWSYYIANNTPLNNTLQSNPRIPFYNNGELLCGELPDGGNQNHNPVADIVANPISGDAPLTVSFDASGSTDSDGDVLTYNWDFDDGNSATGVTNSHIFTTPGIYTVTLSVDDGNGGTTTETVNITVIDATPQPPTADLVANPTNGGAPLTVAFDASGSTDPNGDNLTYTWDFGDGNTGIGETISHIYTTIGTYIATLTVDDGNGGTDTQTVTIQVTNTPPTATFTATPTSGQPPLAVIFDASGSTDSDGDALTYTWDFGDGNSATGVTTNHTYQNVGSYIVTLTVTDGNGGNDTFSTTIYVTSANGTCDLSLKYRTFDNSNSNATDNQIRPHFIVENNGNSSINLNDITIRYWYTKEGTADQNAWIDYAQIGSNKVTTNFVEMANPVNGADHYLEVGFTANAGQISPNANSGQIQARFHKTNWSNYDENDDHSYSMNHGTFLPWDKVTVYCNGILAYGTEPNGAGGGGANIAPIAAFTATPTSGDVPLIVNFDASTSSDADNDALTYTWDFGDGTTGLGMNTTHTYNSPGTFTATLTVSDGNGGSDDESTIITVNNTGGNGDIELVFTVNSNWNVGYCANITIVNNTGATINGWTLDFALNANINNLWNANWSNTGGNNYTTSNLNWNANIPDGGSRTFGFCASYSGTLTAPSNGMFNGSSVVFTFAGNPAPTVYLGNSPVSFDDNLVLLPNLTTHSTTIKYDLPTAGAARILLFDQTGKLMKTILDEPHFKGQHSIEFSTSQLPAGNYFVRLLSQEITTVKRLVIVR